MVPIGGKLHSRVERYWWPLSEENVEIIRRAFDAFDRGEVDSALADADPGFVTYRAEPDGLTYHGREGFLKATADWTEGFDQWTVRAEEFIEAGDDVVVRLHQRARGRTSGVPIEGEFWFVFTLSGGRMLRLDMHTSKGLAFDVAGLAE